MAVNQYPSLLGLPTSDMWNHLNTTDLYEQMRQAGALQAQQAAQMPMPVEPTQGTTRVRPDLAGRAREMFLKRMGGIRAEMKLSEGDFLQCHVYGETVIVFYCFGGKEGSAKESIDLFPSDQFITQFRMIIAT